jgi:DNA-binding PadR family transcriptional regulator
MDTDAFLPLQPAAFHILMALGDDDRHGYAILQDIAARTGGRVRLSPATLYRTIERLLDAGLILELDERPDPEEDDARRRYYRLSPLGRKVARAEARRLADLVSLARESGLAPKRT